MAARQRGEVLAQIHCGDHLASAWSRVLALQHSKSIDELRWHAQLQFRLVPLLHSVKQQFRNTLSGNVAHVDVDVSKHELACPRVGP